MAVHGRARLSRREALIGAGKTVAGVALGGLAAPSAARAQKVARASSKEHLPKTASAQAELDARFATWNRELLAKSPGRDVGLLDLDAVDRNIDLVRANMGEQFALRIVTKSLPCIALIRHILARAHTHRVMAFSEGMLAALLETFGDSLDILLGRPMPVDGARRILARRPRARRLQWLLDTPERAASYAALAGEVRERLEVAVEIDVGLRRGGALDAAALASILEVVASHPSRLRFSGLMGYEGHVRYAEEFGFNPDAEFAAVHERYDAFVRAGASSYPELFAGTPVYNSGGSSTYYRYGPAFSASRVNDIALGSAFLFPSDFAFLGFLGHRAASFLASPVLKKIDPAEVPFLLGYLPSLAATNPSLEVAFFMVGAGFPGDVVAPQGLVFNPFVPGAGVVRNLLPNQTVMNGSRSVPLSVGDFVLHHAWEGDGIGWLGSVLVLQGDTVVAEWETFRESNTRPRGRPGDRGS